VTSPLQYADSFIDALKLKTSHGCRLLKQTLLRWNHAPAGCQVVISFCLQGVLLIGIGKEYSIFPWGNKILLKSETSENRALPRPDWLKMAVILF
jgi:hypothetical protein